MSPPLFDPPSHEPVTPQAWSERRAQSAIAQIAADADAAFDADDLWPVHPLDDDQPEPLAPTIGLYLGAAGMVWALDSLAGAELAEPARDWAAFAGSLPERYRSTPDLPELTDGRPVPSLLAGEAGVLLAARRLAPAAWHIDRMVELVRANAQNPTRELMWGSPGTMLAAELLFEQTRDQRLADAWRESAEWLLDEWREQVWVQQLYGSEARYVGPGHGFAGNVFALTRGELLDEERRDLVEARAVATVRELAQREGDLVQWPPLIGPMPEGQPIRTQWCHGAPGMVMAFAALAPDDDDFTELLEAGGELTWTAGPLVKGAGLCHGTAGNGFALLKLFERTGDERWLERARRFGMHAAGQVAAIREKYGQGRYTLWNGDVGVALLLAACLTTDAAWPTLDVA